MGLMFEVAEGGFLDIDVRIEGKSKLLYQNIQRNEKFLPWYCEKTEFKIIDRT